MDLNIRSDTCPHSMSYLLYGVINQPSACFLNVARSRDGSADLSLNLNAFEALGLQWPLPSLGDPPLSILPAFTYLWLYSPALSQTTDTKNSGKPKSLLLSGINEKGRVHDLFKGRRVWSGMGRWPRWRRHVTLPLRNTESVPWGKRQHASVFFLTSLITLRA